MKKQIFILVLIFLSLGIYQGFAQTITPTPLDPTCIDLTNPLKPVPGNPYTYTVDVPQPDGNKSFRWYVTQDPDFATAGVYNWATAEPVTGGPILAAGSAHYNVLTAGAAFNTISLTWQSFTLNPGEYVFVVVYVENEQTTAPLCTTNNLKVYRIQPIHAFTLDLASVDSATSALAGANFPTCADDVKEAHFDETFGTDGGVVYDYGKNILYYAMAAANFSGQYELEAQFTGLQLATPSGTTGQIAELYWDYVPLGEANGPIAVTEGATLDLGIVEAQSASGTVGSAGEMVYIKVVIRHNSFEVSGAQQFWPYTFAVNGRLVDATGTPLAADDSFDDLHYANCSPDLFVNDVTTQRIVARPTMIPGAPNFLPIAP